jgi:hypothetical protein
VAADLGAPFHSGSPPRALAVLFRTETTEL